MEIHIQFLDQLYEWNADNISHSRPLKFRSEGVSGAHQWSATSTKTSKSRNDKCHRGRPWVPWSLRGIPL